MSRLLYASRVEKEQQYYIDENFDPKSLMKLFEDLEESIEVANTLKRKILLQYQKATRRVEYKRVILSKDHDRNNHVQVRVCLEKYYKYEGVEVKSEMIYSTNKEYSYKELKQAKLYAMELIDTNPGATLDNRTGYKMLDFTIR